MKFNSLSVINKMRFLLFPFLISFSAGAWNLTPGDTNKTDAGSQKQGYWKEKDNATGMDWCGNYVNNKKEGTWMLYHPSGLLHMMDTYKDGFKNGISIAVDNNGFFIQLIPPFVIQ